MFIPVVAFMSVSDGSHSQPVTSHDGEIMKLKGLTLHAAVALAGVTSLVAVVPASAAGPCGTGYAYIGSHDITVPSFSKDYRYGRPGTKTGSIASGSAASGCRPAAQRRREDAAAAHLAIKLAKIAGITDVRELFPAMKPSPSAKKQSRTSV